MRNKRFNPTTRTVVSDNADENIGARAFGTWLKSPGTISTLNPKINAMPTAKVRRMSSKREVMTWRPPTIMKHATYTRTAPITGTGMIEKVAANLGQNASAMTNNPVGNAMTRLVVPQQARQHPLEESRGNGQPKYQWKPTGLAGQDGGTQIRRTARERAQIPGANFAICPRLQNGCYPGSDHGYPNDALRLCGGASYSGDQNDHKDPAYRHYEHVLQAKHERIGDWRQFLDGINQLWRPLGSFYRISFWLVSAQENMQQARTC